MFERAIWLAPAFLAAQAAGVYWISGMEHPPAPPALSRFPNEFGSWRLSQEDPIAAEVLREIHADRSVSRIYSDRQGSSASLFLAWFQSQRGGASQPHSPEVCLPGSGWIPVTTGELALDTAAGSIAVNRYVVANHGQRAVVLYWYQTRRRAMAGEWASKFWSVADALRDRRTDIALVRVVVWAAGRGDNDATNQAADFARSLYPSLREYLPR